MPVSINLDNPTFVELNSIEAEVDSGQRFEEQSAVTTVDTTTTAMNTLADIWVSKERRTAVPSLNDNSIIAHFVLTKTLKWICISAGTANVAYLSTGDSTLRDKREYEDERTGQGFLIAQPRLFVLIRDMINMGPDLFQLAAQSYGLTMKYRLTTRVTAREFMTEVIANTFA